MTAEEAQQRLEELVGSELGTGDWTVLSRDRVELFGSAIGQSVDEVPALLLLSLIPGLTSTINLPIEQPRTTVNYGLEKSRLAMPAKPGDRLRARVILLGVEAGAEWIQLKRRVVLENETEEPVLDAETLTRLWW